MNTHNREGRTAALAVVSAAVGSGAVIALLLVQDRPEPLWLWAVFAAAFTALELSSVEVNDRLFISSSIMVVFAAMVVFGRHSAFLAVVVMAGLAALHPADLRQRRWRQPTFNFGQLVLSTLVGAVVLYPFLPSGTVTVGDISTVLPGAALAAIACNLVNFRLVSAFVRAAYPERSLLPWTGMMSSHFLHALLGAYGGLVGIAYQEVGPVSLPMLLVTFLVGHHGFAAYSKMRRAHEDTVGGFVKAVEALDPYTKGHTDRVARFSRMTGERLLLDAEQQELLRWAALIHDVGKLAAPADLVRKETPLTPPERERLGRRVALVENLLAQVEFLRPALAAVRASSGDPAPSLIGRSLIGRIVAAADAFDIMTAARSYRAALSQTAAFGVLRGRGGHYGPEVVEALIGSIEDSGVVYGSPDPESVAEVERLVQDRARRG